MSEIVGRLNRTIEARGPDPLWVESRDALVAAYGTIADLHERLASKETDLASRATVPDAATEELERIKPLFENLSREYPNECNKRVKAEAERDAALAAVERVRAIISVKWRDGGVPSHWHSQLTAALDGAPEPEWEYGLASRTARIPNVIGVSDNMPLRDEFGRVTVRRRKAGPWEPVGGEN